MGNKGKDKEKVPGKGKINIEPEPEDISKNPNDKKGTGEELLELVRNDKWFFSAALIIEA